MRSLDYYFLSLLRLRHYYFYLFNLIFRRIDCLLRLLFAVRLVILLLHHFFHSICINALAFHLTEQIFRVVGESAVISRRTTVFSIVSTELRTFLRSTVLHRAFVSKLTLPHTKMPAHLRSSCCSLWYVQFLLQFFFLRFLIVQGGLR